MLLQHSSWPEVEAYLARSRGIVIPIGSTEQHGPNGLIGTDALCPELIARRAAETVDMLIGPTFNVGMAAHHMGFAGTMTLRPSTMIAALHDWVSSLAHHGFERIYFFNGHGGNIATIKAAFSEIAGDPVLSEATDRRGPVRCKVVNWWDFEPVTNLCRDLYGASHGYHATPSEVAVTRFALPQAIKNVEMSPKIAPLGRYSDAVSYRAQFPDGRIGSDPSLATPQDGEKLVELSAAGLAGDYLAFLAE
ncbi:MAG: creatininase family protein [Parvibaculaceae bacterium]|nr:creatininase family protein [Parvibaculaceae bacterium]